MPTPSAAALLALLVVGGGVVGVHPQQSPCDTVGPTVEQLYPYNATQFPKWADYIASLRKFRDDCLASINYNGSIYEQDAINWTQTAFMQPQMHPYDLFFYTRERGYDVAGWLDDLSTRYGGIDAALIWPTYTNIGIDSRSQFQLITDMPGGVDAIRNFSAQLKAAGVRVLWPYNPWDLGSHRDAANRTDAEMLAWLTNATDTDGFNGDTMKFVSEEFYAASLDVGHPLAIEPEGGGVVESLGWDTMGWGYWHYDTVAPALSKWKTLEPRFTTNVCARWATNKTDNLQYAWFNGAGYETWENVWGTWNEIVPADAEAVRTYSTIPVPYIHSGTHQCMVRMCTHTAA
jgi:iron(II)-dependent oxidoreductase